MQKLPAPPVVTRPEYLPLLDPQINFERFEAFCRDLASHLPSVGGSTYHYGIPGDTQLGVDIICQNPDGVVTAIQCKRVEKFSLALVREMVKVATYEADHFIAMLACEASVSVRRQISKHPTWELWDIRDISWRVRNELPLQEATRLVRQHFGEVWCSAFLGLSVVSERIAYEQTARQRFGTLTKSQIVGIGCLGSAASLMLTGTSMVTMPQLPLSIVPLAALLFGLALAAITLLLKIAWMVLAGEKTIRILNTLIEIDDDGLVYWSKVIAHCPICEGKVDIEGTPEHFGLNTVGVCERNPRMHIFTFDKTVMAGDRLPIELLERLQRHHESRN